MTERERSRYVAHRAALIVALGAGLASCDGTTFSTGTSSDAGPSDGADPGRDAGANDAGANDAANDAGRSDAEADAGRSDADSGGGPTDGQSADRAGDVAPPEAGADAADAGRDATSADAGSTYRAAVLADGPAAYWRMGIAQGTLVPDESGHENPLLLQGEGHQLGAPGALVGDGDRAIAFDGVGSYATALAPGKLDFPASAPFTVECWARREDATDGGTGEYFQHLVSAAEGGPPNRNGYLLYLLPYDSNPAAIHSAVEYDAPDEGQIAAEGPIAPASTYGYYVATFDGAKIALYVDGALAASRAVDGSLKERMSDFVVGREGSTGRYHFRGAIDEIAVYDKALSLAQIAAHRAIALRR